MRPRAAEAGVERARADLRLLAAKLAQTVFDGYRSGHEAAVAAVAVDWVAVNEADVARVRPGQAVRSVPKVPRHAEGADAPGMQRPPNAGELPRRSIALVAACTVGPDFVRPEVDLPAGWVGAAAASAEDAEPIALYKALGGGWEEGAQ